MKYVLAAKYSSRRTSMRWHPSQRKGRVELTIKRMVAGTTSGGGAYIEIDILWEVTVVAKHAEVTDVLLGQTT